MSDAFNGLSGVPMRAKKKAEQPKPDGMEMLSALGAQLVESQRALAAQVANVLTSPALSRNDAQHPVEFDFIRDAQGRLVAGTATAGDRKWALTMTHGLGGRCQLSVTPQ